MIEDELTPQELGEALNETLDALIRAGLVEIVMETQLESGKVHQALRMTDKGRNLSPAEWEDHCLEVDED